jgi:hypothetical protein
MNKFPQYNYTYTHKNAKELLLDININYDDKINLINSDKTFILNDSLYICTWYGVYSKTYLDKYHISFNCLYQIFNDILKQFFNYDITKENPKIFIPSINFEKYNINNCKNFLQKITGKKILICNGKTKSAQGYDLNLTKMAVELAKKHGKWVFFLTNNVDNTSLPQNVIYTPTIIQNSGSDLNENAYIGSQCDVIAGQLSGCHTFCYNAESMANKSKIITFWRPTPNIISPYFFEGAMTQSEISNKFIASNSNKYNECLNLIEKVTLNHI